MEIAFIDWTGDLQRPGIGGMSDIVWGLAEHLAANGENIHIVAPYEQGVVFPSDNVAIHRFKVPPIGYRNIIGHSLIVLAAWRALRRISHLDVIHAPEYLTTGLIAPLTRVPVVLTVPGNVFERLDNVIHTDRPTTEVHKIVARLTARFCACIIATSQEMQRWWEYSGAEPARIVQIPLGVDTQVFRPRSNARQTLGLNPDKRIVLFVGRLVGENGPSFFLRAGAIALAEMPEQIELHVIGTGSDQAALQQLARESGIEKSIVWHGWVDIEDLPLYYSAADIFLLPRLSRVTPRVLFQAMACQNAIITSDIGGIQDFIVDGETGILVDPREPDLIAQSICGVLRNHDLASDLGRAARHYAVQELDWRVVATRVYQEVYLRL